MVAMVVASLIFNVSFDGPNAPSAAIGGELYVIQKDGKGAKSVDASSGAMFFSSNDCSQVIQRSLDALAVGGTVLVDEGVYDLSREIDLKSDVRLVGKGPGTVFRCEAGAGLQVVEQSNVFMSNFSLEGKGNIQIVSATKPSDNITLSEITATVDYSVEGAFCLLAMGEAMVSNVHFYRCSAIDCETNGFINSGRMEDGNWISNITYVQCRSIDSGSKGRYNDWVVGFDLAERANVRNMMLIECEASRNWQSGFHFESAAKVENVTLERCVAMDNGQANGAPGGEGYGWGYLLSNDPTLHDITLIDCEAKGNWRGDTDLGPLSRVQG